MSVTLTAADLEAAAAALRGYGAPDLPHHVIQAAVDTEPNTADLAREHGWADGEVVDKLWAVICVRLLGIDYTEQMARFLTRRQELADDVEAAVLGRQAAR